MAGVWIFVVVVLVRWIQLTSGSCTPGQFGDSCSYSCHCQTSCDETTGACTGDCDTGWKKAGGLCQKQNIALNKAASTSSEVYEDWYPSKAVDGDSDIGGEDRTCFHANSTPSDWTVDLGQEFQLYDIRIYSRRRYYLRNANSNIYLNNHLSTICSTLPSSSGTPNPTDVTCNGTGRYVTIRNPGTGPRHDDTLNICEVEIYACSPGIYGVDCNVFCHCLDSTCDRLTGLCPGDCRPGWQKQRCDTACISTTYGTNCKKACAGRKCSVPSSSCDRHTGACDTGCLPGWIGVDCTQECSSGKYGTNCTSLCSERQCAGNSSCDHVTGSCDSGCKAGWIGVDCKEACNNTTYGINCNKTCAGRKCLATNSSCDRHTGACDTGCLPGWMEVNCTQECTSGKYGANCISICSDRHCAGNSSCDHVTGSCDSGCKAGWMGADCKEVCSNTTYGANCNKTCAGRKCSATNSSCDRHTGACDTGCLPGWIGVDCTQECDSKHYGPNCRGVCLSRNCEGNSSCNSTGTCDSGCLTGWTRADCTECDSQHYWIKCNMTCSSRHCVKNSSCNATGICDGGCEAGWTRDDCAEKVATHTPSQQPEAASFPITAVVGAVVGVVVILLLVLAVIMIRRRRGKSHGRSTHEPVIADNVKPTQAEDIGMYMNVGFDNNEKPENTSTTQIKVSKQNKYQGDSDKAAVSTTGTKDTGEGGTGDLDLQKVEEEEDYDVSDQPEDVEDTPEAPDRNYYNLDDNGRTHVIAVSELQTRVEEMTPASAEKEFKRLPDGYVHSYAESQQPKNKGKNRFRGYYPYDYNRVVLHGVSEDKDKDYINASYLDGYKAEKRYIAAQGPYRPEVVVDFWRMIYQERSTTIVMVTGLVETGKMKCLQYWPENGTSIYGDISVTKETETQLANYTVTKLSVHNKSEGKIHHVHHFHFTSWPDHGVPDTSALQKFMWRVKVTTRH
ncbi:multiple epidermal growth factor-like domains protein 10 isoform X2 [Haliotis rubra]|uniref:multiple epidermal growth factor-like domains protein 10 isoform X2 n=1 Tax=Haliotis rubra TaxID=36100 RepID=UPI001EE5E697|nr:multiple epidermal growth factor-like domains protein 10 isoform X2 [Haliotis rubra]